MFINQKPLTGKTNSNRPVYLISYKTISYLYADINNDDNKLYYKANKLKTLYPFDSSNHSNHDYRNKLIFNKNCFIQKNGMARLTLLKFYDMHEAYRHIVTCFDNEKRSSFKHSVLEMPTLCYPQNRPPFYSPLLNFWANSSSSTSQILHYDAYFIEQHSKIPKDWYKKNENDSYEFNLPHKKYNPDDHFTETNISNPDKINQFYVWNLPKNWRRS